MTAMPAETRAPTPEANLARLDAAIAAVRAALYRYLQQLKLDPAAAAGACVPVIACAGAQGHGALDVLAARFGLSEFERDVLVLAAATELAADLPALCALAHQEPQKPYATFGLALAALPGAYRNAANPDAPLRRFRLVEPEGEGAAAGSGIMHARLTAPEPVRQFLLGAPVLDARLRAVLEPVAWPEALMPSQMATARRIAAIASAEGAPIVHLVGHTQAAVIEIAAAAAALAGLSLLRLREELIPREPVAAEALMRRWQRDSVLAGAALLITFDRGGGEAAAAIAVVARLLADSGGFVIITGEGAAALGSDWQRPLLRLDPPSPDPREIRAAWRRALGDLLPAGLVGRLADQFKLPLSAMQACARAAAASAAASASAAPEGSAPADPQQLAAEVWHLCRLQGRQRLAGLAQRVPVKARAEELVLPDTMKAVLAQIVAHHRHRHQVLFEWGFEQASARGLGLGVLFAGASGTGKTMAAEVIAGELALDLFRIDLSAVVDKYIGETEKNLRRLFDAADETGAVLLFDEADALFGKRGEVRDGRDRYANLEVGYLLQRIEAYRGVALLTTNLPGAIDPAFQRRLGYILHFPFPNHGQRAEIWRRIYPSETPTAALSFRHLAQLNLAGGQIRNVALNAAFLAADAGEPVGMAHIAAAARVEYAKQNRVPSAAEFAGWPA
jgi:hypothetical protein